MSELPGLPAEDYHLKDLYSQYHLYKAALADVELAPDGEWRKVYEERLEEITAEILGNGGILDA